MKNLKEIIEQIEQLKYKIRILFFILEDRISLLFFILEDRKSILFCMIKDRIAILLSKLVSYKLLWILSIILAIIILVLGYLYWVSAPTFLGLESTAQKSHELHSAVKRNNAWMLWMILSFMGLLTGLYFTYWGRKTQEQQWQTQRESHLHERLEKATTMLGNQTMTMRITGCRLLRNLAIHEESMKSQCVHLLFAFINNPYLKPDDRDKSPNDLFPENEPLRPDILEASNSFSAIYHRYVFKGIDNEPINLPVYFWRNQLKDRISIIKANLSYTENLQHAYLVFANLHGINLRGANLREANLSRAILDIANMQEAFFSGADLSYANLQGADLEDAYLRTANLEGANLNGANLNRADCMAASMRFAFLIEANLSYANLQRANLNEVYFRGASMQGADLRGANLKEANLCETNLEEANLQEANLEEAELILANLKKTDLSGTNLQGVILDDADLHEANLSGANIAGADMSNVKNLIKEQILSAKCGFTGREYVENSGGLCDFPILPKEFDNDPEVQEWLATPHFNNEKKSS